PSPRRSLGQEMCAGNIAATCATARLRKAAPWAREEIMRRIRYAVAASLDGYIAGPKGEADWIIMDPEIDFSAIWNEFDTLLIGRKTFERMGGSRGKGRSFGMTTLVFSRTLRQRDHPNVTIVA